MGMFPASKKPSAPFASHGPPVRGQLSMSSAREKDEAHFLLGRYCNYTVIGKRGKWKAVPLSYFLKACYFTETEKIRAHKCCVI